MLALWHFVRRGLLVAAMLAALVAFPAPVRAQSAAYPVGLSPSAIEYGIYPGTGLGNCCWMGRSAALRVAPPAGADTLLLNIYIPPFARQPGGQTLRVRIDGAAWQSRCCLDAGEHELAFALPRTRAASATVLVNAATTFAPAQRGINDDPRQLSVLVRGVAFLNARSGERFDPAPRPWLAPRLAALALAAIGFAILLATLRRPAYGLVALIVTDPFLLALYVHGTTATLPKVALLAVGAALIPHVVGRATRVQFNRAFVLLFAANVGAIAVMLAASLHAGVHGAALRETLKAAEYAATLAIAYLAFRLDPDVPLVRGAFVLLACVVLLPALAQERLGTAQLETIFGRDVARIAGPLEGPNQLAGFLGIVIPAIAAFAYRSGGWLVERAAVALGVVTCALTLSRGGFAALVLALALLAVVHFRPLAARRAGAAAVALYTLASVCAFAAFAGVAPAQALFASHGDRFNGGLGSRVDLWRAAYHMWRAHPLLGIGPGNFEIAVGQYDPGIRTHANGMFFQTLAEQGIVGFVAYLGVVAASVGAFTKRLDNPLALGACMASVALAFHQIVDCIAIYPKVGVMWCVLLGVAAAATTCTFGDTRDTAPPGYPGGAGSSSADDRRVPAYGD